MAIAALLYVSLRLRKYASMAINGSTHRLRIYASIVINQLKLVGLLLLFANATKSTHKSTHGTTCGVNQETYISNHMTYVFSPFIW